MLSFPVVPARLYRLWPSWWCLWFVYTFKVDKYHAKKQFPPCFLPAKNITISQMNECLLEGFTFHWISCCFCGERWSLLRVLPDVQPYILEILFGFLQRMLFVGKGRLKRGFSSRWQPFSDVWMCTFLTISIHFLQVYACKKAQYLGFLMKVAGNPATCHSLAMLPAVAPAVAPSMESSGRRTYRAKTQWTNTTTHHRK